MAPSIDKKIDSESMAKIIEQIKNQMKNYAYEQVWDFNKEGIRKEETKVKPEIKYIDEGII